MHISLLDFPQSYQTFRVPPGERPPAEEAVGPAVRVGPSREADQDPNPLSEFYWRKIKVIVMRSSPVRPGSLRLD